MIRISSGKEKVEWPPVMKTATLVVTTTGQTTTLAAPGAGFKIEVYGAISLESVNAAFTYASYAHLSFATSSQRIMRGVIGVTPGVVVNTSQNLTGVRIAGNDNEALTLTNYGFGAGTSTLRCLGF